MKRLAVFFLAAMLVFPGLAQAKIFLADTDDTLRVVTASGVSTIHMYAAWADLTTTALTPGASDAQVTTATTTVLVAAPGASTYRQIKGLSIRNSHASSSNVITVQFFDGTTATELIQYTLLAGETLQWGEDENFRVIDASGQVKGQVALATGSNAIGKLTANSGVDIGDVDVTSVIPGSGATNLGKAEDASHTTGDTGVAALSKRTDTAASSAGTDGDYATLNTDSTGRLWSNTELPDAAALADNTANPTVPGVAAFLMCYDGSTWDRCQGGLTDTDDGTIAGSQVPSLSLMIPYEYDGTNWTRPRGPNTVAHDAADAGNPIKIGAFAETSVSGATAVADGDRTNVKAGIDGVLLVRPHSNLEDRVSGTAGITDGSSTSVVAAQGAGLRFCATTIVVSNSSATNVTVDIRDGTAGSVLMTIPAAANMGGGVISLQTPLCTTANTIFAADPSASASTVAISAVGFKTAL